MILDFIKTGGPYGDATDDYEVRIKPGTTVQEFFNDVLAERHEWGDIKIGNCLGPKVMEFHFGNCDDIDEEFLGQNADVPIKRVHANGGWGYMSYYIEI